MNLGVEAAKKAFFDRAAVTKSVDAARIKGLGRFGAFLRTQARSSLRKRRKASLPGQPPSMHEGSIKRLLFFSYDPSTRSVVVGPARFAAKQSSIQAVGKTVPELLEKGGKLAVQEVQLSGGLWVGSRRKLDGKARPTRTRGATIQARPFMNPALKKVAPQFAEMFRNTVEA